MASSDDLALPTHRTRTGILLICLGPLLVATGCGDSSRSVVSGKVTYQGAPVTLGEITFDPVASGLRPVSGTIKPDGSYRLRFSKTEDALPVGEYVVTVIAMKETYSYSLADAEAGKVSRAELAKPPKVEWLVPEKYSSPEESGLTAEVGSQYSYDFDLE